MTTHRTQNTLCALANSEGITNLYATLLIPLVRKKKWSDVSKSYLVSFPILVISVRGEFSKNIKPFTLHTRLVAYPSVDLFCHSWLLQVNLIT